VRYQFYDRFTDYLILQAARLNGTTQQQFVVMNPVCPGSVVVTNCSFGQLVGLTTSISTVYQIAPNLHAPYIMQSAVSVERQVTKAANVSVSYLHSSGYDQLLTNNINTPLPGQYNPALPQSNRPLGPGNIFQYQSDGIFRQNQVIVNSTVRAGARLTLNGYYSLNYANSDTAGPTTFPSNPFNVLADYGRAAFDIRHRVFVGGTVSLPWDLRLSPFMVAQTGMPYNVTLNQDLIGSSELNQRPGLVSNQTCAAGTAPNGSVLCTPEGTFNTAPGAGAALVPINFLTGPARFTLNLRLSETFGFGKVAETATNRPRGGGGGGGGGRNGGGAAHLEAPAEGHVHRPAREAEGFSAEERMRRSATTLR
jgi:hypothetical protein